VEVCEDELQLAPVVQPEEEVALERLAQIEPEPRAAREADLGSAPGAHGKDPAQAALPPKLDAAEQRIERPLEHVGEDSGMPVSARPDRPRLRP